MGMFRDMGDAFKVLKSDELKELKRKADAQPKVSMMEGVKMANQAMDQVPSGSSRAQR
jgi:cephalosporin hydroxylase